MHAYLSRALPEFVAYAKLSWSKSITDPGSRNNKKHQLRRVAEDGNCERAEVPTDSLVKRPQ
jgi:hypothetical protein